MNPLQIKICKTNFDQDDDIENSSLLSNGTTLEEDELDVEESTKYKPKFDQENSWSEDIPIVQAKTEMEKDDTPY